MEDLTSVIERSLSENSEESVEAMNEINEIEPSEEFFDAMLSIITDNSENEQLQKATIVYIISKLRQHNEAINLISIEKVVEVLCSTTYYTQIQAQRIIYYFVEQKFKEDAVPELIEFTKTLIVDDENSLLVAATIIRRMLKPKGKYNIIAGIGDKEDLHNALYPFFEPIIGQIGSTESFLFIHTVLKAMNSFLKFAFPEDAEQWIEVLCSVMQTQAREEAPFLDKDAAKLAVAFIELQYSNLSLELVSPILESLTSHAIEGASFGSISYIIRFIFRVAQRDEIWETLSEQFSSFLSDIFIPIFVLTPDYEAMFNTEPQQFISLTHDHDSDDFSSPRMSAITALNLLGEQREEISGMAAELVTSLIPQEIEARKTSHIYSLAQFIGSILHNSPVKEEVATQIIPLLVESFDVDNFTKAALFIFLFDLDIPDCFDDGTLINICVQNYDTGSPVADYFAMLDIAHLIKNHTKETFAVDNPCVLIKKSIALSSVFHDDLIIEALSTLIQFFSEELSASANEFMNDILELIKENPVEILEARSLLDVISYTFSTIKESPSVQEICEAYITTLAEISESMKSKDNILYLLFEVLKITPEVTEAISFIPEFLVAAFESSNYSFPIISKIFAVLGFKICNETIAEGIIKLCISAAHLIRKFYDSYFLLIKTLCITLGDLPSIKEIAMQLLDPLSTLDSYILGDIYATLARVDIMSVLNDEIRFRIVIEFSSCLPFLSIAHIILENLPNLGQHAIDSQERIEEKIAKCLEELTSQEANEFYNPEEIGSYYT